MDDDLLNKIERKYGDFGVWVFLTCGVLCAVFSFLLWVAAVITYGWPILLPFIIAGYMLYEVKQGTHKMKALTLTAILLATACTPATMLVCDREAQQWNKYDTVEDTCAPVERVRGVLIPVTHDKESTRPERPTTPDTPDKPDTPDEPDDKPDTPHDDDKPPHAGNPGNHKPVGNAGEKPDKGMDEQGGAGERGRSN